MMPKAPFAWKAMLLAILLAAIVALGESNPHNIQVFKTTRARSFHLQIAVDSVGAHCVILDSGFGQIHRDIQGDDVLVFSKPQAHSHDLGDEAIELQFGQIWDFYGRTESLVESAALMRLPCLANVPRPFAVPPSTVQIKADQITQLIESGPSDNRIDLVFMGDGYTVDEKERHLEDMKRLVADMFASTTFASHTPLFNIWAVFRPSGESGIGVGGKPKNTSYGLYRDGTELRGVYTSKPAAAREACRQVGKDACDYPTLIGNDDYYGGLGGEFTISTRSLTSGTVVLRHEFGHNLVNVGEEYDGGQVYSGVNSARTLNVGWTHWLSPQTLPLKAQQSRLVIQEHAWYLLQKGQYSKSFVTDGNYKRWLLTYSISGAPKSDSVTIYLDGTEIPFASANTMDRTFNYLYSNTGFSKGSHSLTFRARSAGNASSLQDDVQLQLCNYEITEFMGEDLYNLADRNFIGAFNTYRLGGSFVGYRPDHETCLMRNMSSPDFCVVCMEGMWTNLLSRMQLIDDVEVQSNAELTKVKLNAVPLAQLRKGGALPGEKYTVSWIQGSTVRADLEDKFEWELPRASARGSWRVRLQYHTTEVRYDPKELLVSVATFTAN